MRFAPWTAAWFCAALSVITFVADFARLILIRDATQLGVPIVLLAFLPMCFVFVGTQLSSQQREIADLRCQIEALTTKRGS